MNDDNPSLASAVATATEGGEDAAQPDHSAPMGDNPFIGSRGLVGGSGEKRLKNRRVAPYEHELVLRPFDVPAHVEEARELFAHGPVEVEIGFGRSHFFRDRVLQAPDTRFLGFEIKLQWVRRAAKFLAREGRTDCRIVLDDARPLLLQLLPHESVRVFYVFFPDPWWKKRHHKRRVMSKDMIDVMHRLLEPGGAIELRTDVYDYYQRVVELFEGDERFESTSAGIAHDGTVLPLTHREKKCEETGIDIHRIRMRKLHSAE